MAQATVKTVQYIDPRIEPQPDPVYDYVIGPTQNQYYRIPASGKSNSNLTFNNLTTLGVDRAYLDTFEIELTCTFEFELDRVGRPDSAWPTGFYPRADCFTFQSFPFNTCCDEARVNINGGAFFSQPMCYVRAKERYMDQYALSICYANVCPCHKPILQTESGREYNKSMGAAAAQSLCSPVTATTSTVKTEQSTTLENLQLVSTTYITPDGPGFPTRMGMGMYGYNQSSEGMDGNYNNSIIDLGTYDTANSRWPNFYRKDENHVVMKVTWREPLFVSPFSSRYDATYGRPLYNITSMDFSFNLQDLGNMIRLVNQEALSASGQVFVKHYTVNIESAMLCYQVMTIPATLQKPLTTLVPYRRFVPYITDYNQQIGVSNSQPDSQISVDGAKGISITSGVYTLNEIPTAIWLFIAPTKAIYQQNLEDSVGITNQEPHTTDAQVNVIQNYNNPLFAGNWDTNKLFGFIKNVNITMANTTQILNTAQIYDLYRIAKANGCQDSYWSWAGLNMLRPKVGASMAESPAASAILKTMPIGAGSVLRLKPGVDLIVPDVALIPGANANNMVFQATVTADIPPHSKNNNKDALWLLFEYVGVAAISPGQCEITMNPLGSGEIMAVSPVMSATSSNTEGSVDDPGFWDKTKQGTRVAGQLAGDGIIAKILRHIKIPGADQAAEWAEAHGLGEPGKKRGRNGGAVAGGAVIGRGLNDWV